MSRARIIYRDWIVDLGHDPALNWQEVAGRDDGQNQKRVFAVNRALMELTEDESGFIRCYYFMGMGYRDIAESTGRRIDRLERMHRNILRKLKTRLSFLIGSERDYRGDYGDPGCPLCRHPRYYEINELIKSKKETETWRPIIKMLRTEFGIRIQSPQRLIGHRKYHMI